MIETYFQAEKKGGFFLMAIGIIASAIGGGMLLSAAAPFYTGLAVPLAVVGFAQVMVGAIVARRSDFQAEDLRKLLRESPAEFRQLELPRMTTVLRNFVRIKWIEVAFIVLGLAVILLNESLNFPKGLGAGLLVQGLLMLIFDFFAEKRGKEYFAFVNLQ